MTDRRSDEFAGCPIPPVPGVGPVTQTEADEIIREVEERLDLLRFTIGGWSVWPLLRLVTQQRTLKQLRYQSLAARMPRGALAWQALWELPRLFSLPRTRLLALGVNTSRSELRNGKAEDIYLDGLLGAVEGSVKIERLTAPEFPYRRARMLWPPAATLTPLQAAAFFLRKLPWQKEVSRISIALANALREEPRFGRARADRIADHIGAFHWTRRLWGPVLRRAQPSVVVVCDVVEAAITAACRELAIPVVELQHGAFDRDYAPYSYSPHAERYRSNLPLPDHLFLYGDYWAQVLADSGFWDGRLATVGSARMDQARKALHGCSKPNDHVRLLYTSGGDQAERVIRFFQAFMALDHVEPIRLCLKLHPVADGDPAIYQDAFRDDARVEVVAPDQRTVSTHELIARSHMHTSICSTCHYESLALGTPTVILRFPAHESVLQLHDAGMAPLVDTPEQLLRLVNDRHRLGAHGQGNRLFKPNAVSNMAQALEQIIAGRGRRTPREPASRRSGATSNRLKGRSG